MVNYYILGLNKFKFSDEYIEDIREILNQKAFFERYDRYKKINSFMGKFIFIYPIVMFIGVFFTGGAENYPESLMWLGLFWCLSVTIYAVIIDPIYTYKLERKLNFDIHKELSTNITLQSYYINLDFEVTIPKKKVNKLPSYLEQFEDELKKLKIKEERDI